MARDRRGLKRKRQQKMQPVIILALRGVSFSGTDLKDFVMMDLGNPITMDLSLDPAANWGPYNPVFFLWAQLSCWGVETYLDITNGTLNNFAGQGNLASYLLLLEVISEADRRLLTSQNPGPSH